MHAQHKSSTGNIPDNSRLYSNYHTKMTIEKVILMLSYKAKIIITVGSTIVWIGYFYYRTLNFTEPKKY